MRIIGKANYKNRSYWLGYAGKTKYGEKANLIFSDGSKNFWVDLCKVEITKKYERPKNLESLLKFKEEVKNGNAGTCDECGRSSSRLYDCLDSSGISGRCCSQCSKMSRYERSFM